MPLGGQGIDDVLAALDRNKKFLRGEIARRVNLKFAPDIRFRVDERFDEAERIEKLLRTPAVQRDLTSETPEESTDESAQGSSSVKHFQDSTQKSDERE
jgi:ribosome-binding factor A